MFNRLVVLVSIVFSSSLFCAGQRVVLPKNVTPLHYQLWIAPDSDKLTFDGRESIDLQVNDPTNSIVLNAADLKFKKAAILGVGAATASFDTKQETVTLQFAQTLKPSKYTLQIDYSGQIFKSAAGLFALDYVTGTTTKRGLYTQLENADARRWLPCFDEPGLKATFELSVRVPADQMPVSNTPIVESKAETDKMKTVRFGRTPKMSTYLLFFGLGDFERITRTVNGVEIGLVVKRGDTAKAQFALDAAAEILPFYEDYFGLKYPLPKLDLIAAPGNSQIFSAMENWGAILYFDRAVLIDPTISTEHDRRYVYLVIAHEMAHQWFGDLVTMEWWDDLWLNEGFATWMETYATDHFHPEWKAWAILRDATSDGMRLDAKFGTHPIVQPILDVFQAAQAFDSITYSKGAGVIRMLEAYVGADKFRDGLRSYMKKYAYKNTVSDDLWREIGEKVTDVAHAFTLQAGVPLIDVKRQGKGWRLEQSVFVIDESTPKTQSWPVPVDATQSSVRTDQIVSREKPATIVDARRGSFYVNSERSGYYRTRYDEQSFHALLSKFDRLPMEVQLGLIDDNRELGSAAYVPMPRSLALTTRISPRLNSLVLTGLLGTLSYIDYFYTDLPTQKSFRTFALRLASPLLSKVGWTPLKTDDANTAEFRAALIGMLGHMGDKNVIQKSNAYFDTFLKNKSSLPPELRSIVLKVVAEQGHETRWQQIYELALKATSVVEQQQYYHLLATNLDRKLAQKTLELALDPKTPATVSPGLIKDVAILFPRLAFEFALAHQDWLSSHLESGSQIRFLPEIISGSYDRTLLVDLDAFAKKNVPPSAMQTVEKTIASIKFNADIREKRLPEIDSWLKQR